MGKKYSSFRVLFLSLLVSAFFHLPARAAGGSALEEAPPVQGRKIPINFASLDVGFGVNLADLTFFDGLRISTKYKYQVEPSYQGGYFTRIDSYNVKVGISPGDFFAVEDLPVYLRIERGSEIIFVRQFESQSAALASVPVFDPRRIPFNSKLALEHMQPGDFVAIPAVMSVAIGANANYPIVPGISANLGVDAGIVSGKFQLHVFRMPDNKVRLRLISDHGNHFSASVGLKSAYDVIGVNLADNLLAKFIKADLPKLTHTRQWGNLVLLDYVYDLKKAEVRAAYDRVLKSTFRFRWADLTLMESLRDKLVSDLLDTERIRLADMNLPADQQRIHRLFSADNEYKNHATRVRLGSSFVHLEGGLLRAENNVTNYDKGDNPTRYNYLTAVSNFDTGVAWGFWRYQRTGNLSALVSKPDHGGALSELENVNLSFEVKDKHISQKQSDGLIESLDQVTDSRIFPPALFDPWRNAEKIRDGRFLIDLWITKIGLRQLEGQSSEELFKKFARYVDDQKLGEFWIPAERGGRPAERKPYALFYKAQIRSAAEKLAKVLDPKALGLERGRAFTSLKGNVPFERLGTGFLISQLARANLDRSVLVRVRADAAGISPIRSVYGRAENLELLNSLQYMQYVIGNGYFDPRWDPIPDLSRRDDPLKP